MRTPLLDRSLPASVRVGRAIALALVLVVMSSAAFFLAALFIRLGRALLGWS